MNFELKNLFSVKSKVVIITGGNRGNGFALAKGLAELGAIIIRIDLEFDNNLNTNDIIFDISKTEEIKKIVVDINNQYGKIDGLINNAGVSIQSEKPYEDFLNYQKTLSINLNAAFAFSSSVASIMSNRGKGSIINITSLGAERGFPSNPSYQISKAGLRQLTKAMARDWGKYNLRFNNICPGYIKTKMTEKSFIDNKKSEERLNQMILKRWGESIDLLGPAVFLLSDASSYITGSDIYVDGGWICNGGL